MDRFKILLLLAVFLLFTGCGSENYFKTDGDVRGGGIASDATEVRKGEEYIRPAEPRELSGDEYFYFSLTNHEFPEYSGSLADYEPVPEEYFVDYISPYDGYNSGYFKSFLSCDELIIYNAVMYAYDSGSDAFCVPEELYGRDILAEVLPFAECDSPLIEFNIMWGYAINEYPELYDMTVFKINTATKEKLESRKTAIDKASLILDKILPEPDGMDDIEKAWDIYKYLVGSVRYTGRAGYGDGADYLYDALVLGETNCDGFSAGLALLFNMAGIETMGVYYDSDQGGEGDSGADGVGHAWNIAKIGEEYYMFDASNERNLTDSLAEIVPGGTDTVIGAYFAVPFSVFAEKGRAVGRAIERYVPDCTDRRYMDYACDLVFDVMDPEYAGTVADSLSGSNGGPILMKFGAIPGEGVTDGFFREVLDVSAGVAGIRYVTSGNYIILWEGN